MSSSKIDHKELQKRLKEDEMEIVLGEISRRSRSIYQQYGSQILMGLAVLVLAYLAFTMWQRKTDTDNINVQQQFAVANTLIQQEQYEAAIQQLNALLSDFPKAKIAPLASMLRADSYTEQGEFELAVQDYLNAAAGLKDPDKTLAQIGLIQAYRSLNRPDDALTVVNEMLASVQSEESKNLLYYLKGLCHEDQGATEEALQSLYQIDTTSSWFLLARQRLEWLEAQAVNPIN